MNEPRPGAPIDECRDCESLLAAYVDGEAAAPDGDRVRGHLEACGVCRGRIAVERAAREAVRERRAGLKGCAPPHLKARCAAYAALSGRPAGASFVRRWAPVSLAASMLLVMSVVFGFGLTNKVQALTFQATIDHVKCSRLNGGSAPVDPLDAARHWQSSFGWAIKVPASADASGLELRAVRRCALTDGRVAHLLYSWMGEPLSVYVLPKRALGEEAEFARRFRHNAVMWSRHDRTYIMVTPHRRDPELDQVVAYVRANAY